MEGLLEMDPKERLTAKQALMHKFFDGLRTKDEEEQISRTRVLSRVDSSNNNRNANSTISRNGEGSRSRSGLRNTKIVKKPT